MTSSRWVWTRAPTPVRPWPRPMSLTRCSRTPYGSSPGSRPPSRCTDQPWTTWCPMPACAPSGRGWPTLPWKWSRLRTATTSPRWITTPTASSRGRSTLSGGCWTPARTAAQDRNGRSTVNRPDSGQPDQGANQDDAVWLDLVARLESDTVAIRPEAPAPGEQTPIGTGPTAPDAPERTSFRDFDPLGLAGTPPAELSAAERQAAARGQDTHGAGES